MMQSSAIFLALKEMGIKYVNTPQDFFAYSQFILYPSEALQVETANCIEGALVFASAFEALEMRPVLVLVPGHAFVGVRLWKDENLWFPIETTMVGTGEPGDAIERGFQELDQWGDQSGIIDVQKCRNIGLLPWPI
jgi:hypothetical protein